MNITMRLFCSEYFDNDDISYKFLMISSVCPKFCQYILWSDLFLQHNFFLNIYSFVRLCLDSKMNDCVHQYFFSTLEYLLIHHEYLFQTENLKRNWYKTSSCMVLFPNKYYIFQNHNPWPTIQKVPVKVLQVPGKTLKLPR